MGLGERIKEIRNSLGWTQERLAKEADLSKSFLSEVENNKANLSGDNLLKLANALNASLDYLMKGDPAHNEARPNLVEIPSALSEFAEEQGLSYKTTIDLLSTQQALLARRSSKEKIEMTKQKWKEFYERLRGYLE